MKRTTRTWVSRAVIAGALLVIAAAAIISRTNRPDESNVIENPSFENGDKAWEWLSWSGGWAPFEISGEKAHRGGRSALLRVSSADETRSTVVWGVVQELSLPVSMPACLEGHYYVERWERGAAKQYIQAVIIDLSKKLRNGNAQMRYILSGVSEPPYNLGNARYVFVDPEKKTSPPVKRWVRFTINPKKDFEKHWGYVPPAGHRLRLLFESRFDGRRPDDPEARAEVYYDNLYLGPAAGERCE